MKQFYYLTQKLVLVYSLESKNHVINYILYGKIENYVKLDPVYKTW